MMADFLIPYAASQRRGPSTGAQDSITDAIVASKLEFDMLFGPAYKGIPLVAATAAALPPLEPPGAFCRSHGLRVAPKVAVSVNGHIVSSGTFVLPITIAPASRSRRTTSASALAGPP